MVFHQTDEEIGHADDVIRYQNTQTSRHSGYHVILDWDLVNAEVVIHFCAPGGTFRAYHVRSGTPRPGDEFNGWIALSFNYKGNWADLPPVVQAAFLGTAADLICAWNVRYSIPLRRSRDGGWEAHAVLDPGRRFDPRGFPWRKFASAVRKRRKARVG